MSKWTYLVLLLYLHSASSIYCFEGTDCNGITNCNVCQGSLCLRISKYNLKKGYSTALTCMPESSLSYYPEGCKSNPVRFQSVITIEEKKRK